MTQPDEQLVLYLQLAQASERRRKPMVRDKLLLLAAVRAIDLKLEPIAAFCRHKILAHNPAHLVRHYEDIRVAMEDDRFQTLRRRLQRSYPRERAEHMLRSLGLDGVPMGDADLDSYECAAALLGTTAKELDAWHYHGTGPTEPSASSVPASDGEQPLGSRRSGKDATLFGLYLLGAAAVLAVLVSWLLGR